MLNRDIIESIAALYPDWVLADVFRHPIVNRGYLNMAELIEIVRWKSPRSITYVQRNNAKQVKNVTLEAFADQDPCSAVRKLDRLHGVGVRIASAILTVFDPCRYTVLDVRAWASLEMLGLRELGLHPSMSPDRAETYAAYLAACKRLALEHGVTLRTLDRCLWVLDGEPPGGRRTIPEKHRKPVDGSCTNRVENSKEVLP